MGRAISPVSRGAYNPGSGIPVTRANIIDEQARRAYEELPPASVHDIVMAFVTPYERTSKCFVGSKRYEKLVDRAGGIMRTMQRRGSRHGIEKVA